MRKLEKSRPTVAELIARDKTDVFVLLVGLSFILAAVFDVLVRG